MSIGGRRRLVVIDLAAGDYVEMYAFQNSAGALNVELSRLEGRMSRHSEGQIAPVGP